MEVKQIRGWVTCPACGVEFTAFIDGSQRREHVCPGCGVDLVTTVHVTETTEVAE